MDIRVTKTEAFLKAIRKRSKAKCKEMDAETEKVRAIRLDELEKEAQKKYQEYVDYEVDRIAAKTNREISKMQEESRKEIADLRKSLGDAVFNEVKAELKQYRTTKDYKNRVLKDAKTLSGYLEHAEPVLMLSKEDAALEAEVKSAFAKPCTVTFCDDILLGGIKGVDKVSQQLVDFTLDAELEEEKTWFLEHSNLVVEE